jgi:Sec-independent protein translocase protein TatA
MAFGSEVLLLLGAGFVVLGPKRMQTMLGQVGRAKAQFDKASRSFMSEVSSGLDETTGPTPSTGDHDNRQDTELVLPDELIERFSKYRTASP